MTIVPITYFSDMLCIWAYVAQYRVNAIKAAFGDRVVFEPKFCSVFGASDRKISTTWRDKGGYKGFNAHLRQVAARFPEIPVSPDLWLTVRPASSSGPQLFLKALQLLEADGGCAEGTADVVTWTLRRTFFEAAKDIAQWRVQCQVAEEAGVDLGAIETLVRDGRAFAALTADFQDADALGVQGSPSFVLNDGRQKLYGNIGYKLLQANIEEVMRTPSEDQASWC